METRKYNVYKFAELSDEQKQTVIDKERDINVSHEWRQDMYNDAETIGIKLSGFNLDWGGHTVKAILSMMPLQQHKR